MMISTRGRYALRVLIDLADHNTGGYIPMKDVAARQRVSLKYLERILPILTKAKLIEGVHGKGGAWLVRDLDELWKNDASREALMTTVRMMDTNEEIIGLSGHLLAVSERE